MSIEPDGYLGIERKFWRGAAVLGALAISAFVIIAMIAFEVQPFNFSKPDSCKSWEELEINELSPDALTPENIRKQLICNSDRHIRWYSRNGVLSQTLLSLGLILIVILTLSTSFLVGTGWGAASPSIKTTAMALPLISTAIATILSQFHLQDSWQLREMGRIEAQEIRNSAWFLDPQSPDFMIEARKISASLSKLENDQALKYFGYRSSQQPEG